MKFQQMKHSLVGQTKPHLTKIEGRWYCLPAWQHGNINVILARHFAETKNRQAWQEKRRLERK